MSGNGTTKPVTTSFPVKSGDFVSWTEFNAVIGALVVLAIAVVGGGFAWLHSDLSDLRIGVRGDLSEVRTDITNVRQSVTALSERLQNTREDILKAVAAIEKQNALTNARLEALSTLTNAKFDMTNAKIDMTNTKLDALIEQGRHPR